MSKKKGKSASKAGPSSRTKAAKPSKSAKKATPAKKAKPQRTASRSKTVKAGRSAKTATAKVAPAVKAKTKSTNDRKPKAKVKSVSKPTSKKLTARAKLSKIVLPPDYRPSEDEPFMSEFQRLYFRQKLLTWKEEIVRQTKETLEGLHEESTQHADLADRATSETDRALELRARDRQRKLIAKIDSALARIEDGTYGYCEDTGEPIGLKRLDARPIATLSLEAQERHERRERVYRED